MIWIILTVLASLSSAVVGVIDKYNITKIVKQPMFIFIIFSVIGLITNAVYLIFSKLQEISFFNIIFIMFTGALTILWFYFYIKAMAIEEASRVSPLLYMSPGIVAILAALFLGEIFSGIKYIGIILLIAGSMLLSTKNLSLLKFSPNLSKSFWLMIIASSILAVQNILDKYFLNTIDFWTVFFYSRIGVFLSVIPIILIMLPKIRSAIKGSMKKAVFMVSISEVLTLLGTFLIMTAMFFGTATLVSALTTIQVFFTFGITVFLSMFFPKIIKEEINKETIFLKIISLSLILVGAVLIV